MFKQLIDKSKKACAIQKHKKKKNTNSHLTNKKEEEENTFNKP